MTVYMIIGVQDSTIVRHQKLGDGGHRTLMCISNRNAKQQDSRAHSCILACAIPYSRAFKYIFSGQQGGSTVESGLIFDSHCVWLYLLLVLAAG